MATVEAHKSLLLESCYAPLTMSYQRISDCYLHDDLATNDLRSGDSICKLNDSEREKVDKALKGIQEIVNILCSEQFFLYLSNITGIYVINGLL